MNTTISASSKSLNTIPDNNSSTSNGAYDTLFAQILASNVSSPKQSIVNQPQKTSISAPNTLQDNNTRKSQATNAAYTVSEGQVVVTVKNSDSDNNNRIYWSTDNFRTRHYISTDNQLGNYNLGAFTAGTKIEFGIDNGIGGFYRTGSALKNPDGTIHAVITKSKNSTQIGFEDVYGGGDYDFNDVVISISNKPAPVNNPTGGGGVGGGGGYPIFNPTKPIPIDGGGITINDNIDWLWQLGLSTASSQELEEMLKKISSLLALKKDNSSLLNNIDFLKTSIDKNKEQSTGILYAEKVDGTKKVNYFDISLMNLTLSKLKNVISDRLEAINNGKILNTDLEQKVPLLNLDEHLNINNVVSSINASNDNQITNITADNSTTIHNSRVSIKGKLSSSTTSTVDVKLLNAIYHYLV